MTGIPPLTSTGSDAAVARTTDRATLAISKAMQERKKEAAAVVRLVEAAADTGKGQFVDYRA